LIAQQHLLLAVFKKAININRMANTMETTVIMEAAMPARMT